MILYAIVIVNGQRMFERHRYCVWSIACAALLLFGAANLGCESQAAEVNPGAVYATASDAKCPGLSIWKERFEYAERLINSEDFEKAQTLLESGLHDCDPEVRQRSLVLIAQAIAEKNPTDHLLTLWRFSRTRIVEGVDIVAKAIIALVIVALLLSLVSVIASYWNRRTISVRPLTISNGGGFDGQHFVAIAADMHNKMRNLRQAEALPGQSAAAPRMMLDGVTSVSADATGALASEQAGKLATAILSILRQPRYTCSGSVHFGGRRTHIIIRLERRSGTVEIWERSSQSARLVEDLKDLTFLALQAASSEARRQWM